MVSDDRQQTTPLITVWLQVRVLPGPPIIIGSRIRHLVQEAQQREVERIGIRHG
jgi:hypothetical protein